VPLRESRSTDAVQAAGKILIDVGAWQATMATINAHKFYDRGELARFHQARIPADADAGQVSTAVVERGYRKCPRDAGLGRPESPRRI
jgi:hypothetical protein